MRESVYSRSEDYVGPMGLSWLYRVSPAQPMLGIWDEEEEEEGARNRIRVADPVLQTVVSEISTRARLFSLAYMSGNVPDLVGFYTMDASLVLPGGRVITGRDAISEYWTLGPEIQVLEHQLRTEMLYGTPDNVIEVSRWFTTVKRGRAEPASFAGRAVVNWQRGSDWVLRMAVDTWHRDER